MKLIVWFCKDCHKIKKVWRQMHRTRYCLEITDHDDGNKDEDVGNEAITILVNSSPP